MASTQFLRIIQDIKDCGFAAGSKYIETNQYNLSIRNLRLRLNDRAYIRKSFKLLQELNEMKRFSEDERTKIYATRDKYGLLSLDTCTREALIESYHIFAPFFQKRYSNIKGKRRIIDFNQGVDARLFTDEIVTALSQIAIRPLRIAFDDIKTKQKYLNAIEMSIKHGLKDFSNYLLYNFTDKPEDLYERMRINVDLCEQYNVSIYSFPMKYHPIRGEHSHDRDYIGEHWNRKYIRAVQAILNATKGKIGRGKPFFEKAFGKNVEEYMELLIMPETFLLYRFFFEYIGYTQAWREDMKKLSPQEFEEIKTLIFQNDFNDIESLTDNSKFRHILAYYKNYRNEIIDPNSDLYRRKKEFDNEQKRITKKSEKR